MPPVKPHSFPFHLDPPFSTLSSPKAGFSFGNFVGLRGGIGLDWRQAGCSLWLPADGGGAHVASIGRNQTGGRRRDGGKR